MGVITISRGSYSKGTEVAEKLAEELGYECISREILLAASEEFNIPEIRLTQAIKDAPSILDRFIFGKERYVAYIRAAVLNGMKRGNAVYHGFAGHFFLRHVPNVLRVRIMLDVEKRVEQVMERENISAEAARRIIRRNDKERRKWSQHLYGIDTSDPSLYDLILNLDPMTVEEAVNVLAQTAQLPCFQMTPEAQIILEDVALAAQVWATLVKEIPVMDVCAEEGLVYVEIKADLIHEDRLTSKVNSIAKQVAGVKEVKVKVLPRFTGG
jgi:cytidylate kinase